MKYCQVCGFEVEPDDNYCSNCCEPLLNEYGKTKVLKEGAKAALDLGHLILTIISVIGVMITIFIIGFCAACN